MKKVISLALGAVMTASLTISAFAATSDMETEPYINDDSERYITNEKLGVLVRDDEPTYTEHYGTKIAYKIQYNGDTESPDFIQLLGRYKMEMIIYVGEERVKSYGIRRMRYDNGLRFVKDGAKTKVKNIYDAGKVDLTDLPPLLMDKILKGKVPGFDPLKQEIHVYYSNYGGLLDSSYDPKEKIYNADKFIDEKGESKVTYQENALNPYTDGFCAFVAVDRWGLDKAEKYGIITEKLLETDINDKPIENPVLVPAYKKTLKNLAADKVIEAVRGRETLSTRSYSYDYFAVIDLADADKGLDDGDIVGSAAIAKSPAQAKDNLDSRDLRVNINYETVINLKKEEEQP